MVHGHQKLLSPRRSRPIFAKDGHFLAICPVGSSLNVLGQDGDLMSFFFFSIKNPRLRAFPMAVGSTQRKKIRVVA